MTGQDIVEKAREYIGTPWHQDARLKGVGIDCSGLLVCTLEELGFEVNDVRGYGVSGDHFDVMQGAFARHCKKVIGKWKSGDILLLRGRMMYNHCGFFVEPDSIIHAYSSPTFMKVVEHPMTDIWHSRIHSVYRLRGLR